MVIDINSHAARRILAAGLVAATLGAAGSAQAVVSPITILNQIGTSPSFYTGANADTSQNFTDFPQYDIAAIDDFTTTGATTLNNVSAATLGFGAFTSYSNITDFEIDIYSSPAAANASLTGNVAHVVIPLSAATVTTPYSGDPTSALVSLPVSISLPTAGTYYISLLSDLSFSTGGEIGVYENGGAPGSTPGGSNAFQENPGGGFGLTGNEQGLGTDLAYSITGTLAVPEPSTWALVGMATASGVYFLRRRGARTT